VATLALNFGADDMEGTVGGEKIAHDAGAASPMELAKERIIRIIGDAGKIPVERDAHYHPLDCYSENVIGAIPYLNSVPFYNYFEKGPFKMLPVVPRRMGELSLNGRIAAGLFSCMDYLAQEDSLEMLDYCIAARDEVKSVMLFSRGAWVELNGKNIGITDDTATSVQMLRVLLEKKYGIKANLVRMTGHSRNYSKFSAVLLIGDEALRRNKYGLPGFKFIFDLAEEWYGWQCLPFVFAVWAVKRSLSPEAKVDLASRLRKALTKEKQEPSFLSELHGRRIGLTTKETREYLGGFTFRLGKKERKAIEVFRHMVRSL
jgi:chorismate dehydratase